MRRLCVGVFLFVFIVQSSGAAIAGTSGTVPSGERFVHLMGDIANFVFGEPLFGTVATGYGARHVAPPRLEKPKLLDATILMHAEHALKPRVRHGVAQVIAMPSRADLDPRHRRLDRLAMRRSHKRMPKRAIMTQQSSTSNQSLIEPLRSLVAAPSGASASGTRGRRQSGPKEQEQAGTGDGTTGIDPWYTYEERAIPGIGKAMLNVGTGNLLVAAVDADVKEQGIDLAFQRVYNSQSLHDYAGDDGGDPAIFGNRWTNNFDANIVYNSTENTITVYDIDGTACTYTPNEAGLWQPCTGEYATLQPTDDESCSYAWIKKDGTTYWFHTDDTGNGACTIQEAKAGHLEEICSRNQVNCITFTYSYVQGEPKTSEYVTKIEAQHTDGHTLVMNFGPVGTANINELSTVTLPDGNETLQYLYDGSGNLVEVDKPGNNSASVVPQKDPDGNDIPAGDAPETYAYTTGTSNMSEACGPRCTISMWNNPNNPTDGSALLFAMNSSLQLINWQVDGVLNFKPSDGTGQTLQPNYSTSFTTWYTASFFYGPSLACTYAIVGATTMCDTDGHATIWSTDGSDRVTETQEWTGSAEGTLMITSEQGWDNNNDLISTTDANGNTTQYAYDTPGYNQGGNVVEVLAPQVQDVYPQGTVSALSTYSYDAFNNVIAYCDPVYNLAKGNQWTNSPTDNLCSGNSGQDYFTANFTQSTNEPYGCLTAMKKPMGFTTDISYTDSSADTCGNGLPATAVAASAITQWSGQNRTPTQDFYYDGYGNLINYDRGTDNNNHLLESSTLDYDKDNRNDWKLQNDAILQQQQSMVMYSYTCLYPDGSLFYTETPSQHNADGNPSCPNIATMLANPTTSPPPEATSYQYDVDGDQIEMITHKGCSTSTACPSPSSLTACASGQSNPIGTTCKYYDGLDRLVETAEPYDSGRTLPNPKPSASPQPYYEFYSFRWMNRYIYDLSQSGGSAQLNIADQTGTTASFAAFGNLYKTQEYLPQAQSNMQVGLSNLTNGQYTGSPGWNDVRGTSFDGLDRPVSKYELAYGTGAVTTNSYDTSGQLDLLGETESAVGQITTYTYDNLKRAKEIAFTGAQPRADTRWYQFDADGRTTTMQNSMGTLINQYDWDGNRISEQEPSASGNPNYWVPSLICWQYYADDLREYVSVAPLSETTSCSGNITYQPVTNGISQPNLLSYAYTHDGLLNNELATWGTNSEQFSWSHSSSGRELTETDPLNGETVGGNNPSFQPASYTYDVYGRVSQLVMPESFEESALAYDEDDEMIGYHASYNGETGVTRALALNARGEMLLDYLPGTTGYFPYAQGATYSANGTQVGNGVYFGELDLPDDFAPPSTGTFDARSGMAILGNNPYLSLYYAYGADDGFAEGGYGYSYDAAGRQTTVTQYPNWPQATSDPTPAYSTTYDTENHVTTTGNIADVQPTANPDVATATATYGPDGHQALTSIQYGGTTHTAAHWDGDTLLFAATSGTVQLYIGQLGTLDHGGNVVVIDRDQTGSGQTMHGNHNGLSAPWFSSWAMGTVRPVSVYIKGQNAGQIPFELFGGTCGDTNQPDCGLQPVFPMTRPDGYAMIGGYVQGARTYDINSGQWLTPDAYAGDVHDPMTQKPFMWNDNNPVQYADPSGYDSIYLNERPTPDFGAWHSFIEVFDDSGHVKERISFGPSKDGLGAVIGAQLTRQPSKFDENWSDRKNGDVRRLVVHCEGSACNKIETNMNAEANNIDAAHTAYGLVFNNSNSAAAAICSAGAGQSTCNSANQSLGKPTPGWGSGVDNQQPQPAAGPMPPGGIGPGPSSPGRFYDAESGEPL